MARLSDAIKGVTGIALLLMVTVGLPWALIAAVGWPLPSVRPDPQLIRAHLEAGELPDAFVVKALAVVVWIVWLQLAIAIAAEIVAVVRGRMAVRTPVAAPVRLFAGRLVAMAVMLITALAPTRTASAAAPITSVPIVVEADTQVEVAVGSAVPEVPATPTEPSPLASAGDGALHRTEIGDTWWDLAERHLGDGLRWRELREHNLGRTVAAGVVIDDSTEALYPGWDLRLPESATEWPRSLGDEDEDGATYRVQPGDSLWSIADDRLGDPYRWTEIHRRSAGMPQPDTPPIDDPDLIWPDSIVWLPEDDVEESASALDDRSVPSGSTLGEVGPSEVVDDLWTRLEADPSPSSSVLAGSSPPPPDSPRPPSWPDPPSDGTPRPDSSPVGRDGGLGDDAHPSGSGSSAASAGPVGVSAAGDASAEELERAPAGAALGVGGFLVASGLLGLLQRTRRARAAEAAPAEVPEPPPSELQDVETVLRDSANPHRASAVRRALASLAEREVRPGEPVAVPEVVRLARDRIEVVQRGEDADLPDRWERIPVHGSPAGRSGAALRVDRVSDSGTPSAWPLPMLVTIGGGLLLNPEAVGSLSVTGSEDAVLGLHRSLVNELATGPAGFELDIRVSDRLPCVELHDAVEHGPLAGLPEELTPLLEAAELTYDAAGAPDVFAHRLSGAASPMDPTMIFAHPEDLPALGPLTDCIRSRRFPLAVVVIGGGMAEVVGAWDGVAVDLYDGLVRLEPYGFTAAAQGLDGPVEEAIGALVHQAAAAALVLRDDRATILPGAGSGDPASWPTEETPEPDVETERPEHHRHDTTERTAARRSAASDGGDPAGKPGDLAIRLLGPVRFDGGPADLSEVERSLLAYLAVAGPATIAQVEAAVWPAAARGGETWQRRRRRIEERLGQWVQVSDDRHLAARRVSTDLVSVAAWIRRAGDMTEDRARPLLRQALDAVRGRPFTGVRVDAWQWTADHQLAVATQASALLIDACFELCDLAYGHDDLVEALWASERAAVVEPLHETAALRRLQLLAMMDRHDEMEAVVEDWESAYADVTGRVPPGTVRAAMEPVTASHHYVG